MVKFHEHNVSRFVCVFPVSNTYAILRSVTNFPQDYVRAGSTSPVNPNMVISGGYDSVVKMYDIRDKSTVCTLDHGAPVESVLFVPSGSLFVTAGTFRVNESSVLIIYPKEYYISFRFSKRWKGSANLGCVFQNFTDSMCSVS